MEAREKELRSGKKGQLLGNGSKNSSKNRSDKRNRLGRMRHERKEQPGMEMGKEIRTFLEKGRRGTQRHPFSGGWWAPESTGWGTAQKCWWGATQSSPGNREAGKAGQRGSTAAPSSLLLLEQEL